MNILHIIPSLDQQSGGPAQVIWKYIDLTRDELNYEILTTNEGLSEQDVHDLQTDSGISIHAFPFSGSHSSKRSKALFSWLWSHIDRFDTIHIHAGFSLISEFSAMICVLRKKRFVYRPLGTLSPYSLTAGHKWFKLLALPLEKYILSKAKFVHCTSPQESTDMLSLVPKAKTVIIPPPVSISSNFQKNRHLPITFGFLSRIHPKKNLELFINALANSEIYAFTFRFLIAGNGDPAYINKLSKLLEDKGLRDKVEYIGFQKGEEKLHFFEEIDWFVLPSYHENFSLATAEALAHGVPCLTSTEVDVTGFDSSSKAFLRLALQENDWTQAIKEIHAEHESYYQMRSKEALRYIETHFSPQTIKNQLVDLYEIKSYR